jgi:hypothetical protein
MPGVGLTSSRPGQARADRLALKPYWGKPAVRNFRGGGGDVGIIRSPVRATALPDKFERSAFPESVGAGFTPARARAQTPNGQFSICVVPLGAWPTAKKQSPATDMGDPNHYDRASMTRWGSGG